MPLSYILGKLIKHMFLVCLMLTVLCHCCHSDKSPYIFLLVLPFFPLGVMGCWKVVPVARQALPKHSSKHEMFSLLNQPLVPREAPFLGHIYNKWLWWISLL